MTSEVTRMVTNFLTVRKLRPQTAEIALRPTKLKGFTARAGAEAVLCAPLWNIDDANRPVTWQKQFVIAEWHVHRLTANLDSGLPSRLTVPLFRLVTPIRLLSGAQRAICAALGTPSSRTSLVTRPSAVLIRNNDDGCASSTATRMRPSADAGE